MNTATQSNVTLTADSTVWVGDVEVTLGHVHAMTPAELARFIQWIARTEYERGLGDGEETLAEATKAYFDEGKAVGLAEGRSELRSAVKLHLEFVDEVQAQMHDEQLKAYSEGYQAGYKMKTIDGMGPEEVV